MHSGIGVKMKTLKILTGHVAVDPTPDVMHDKASVAAISPKLKLDLDKEGVGVTGKPYIIQDENTNDKAGLDVYFPIGLAMDLKVYVRELDEDDDITIELLKSWYIANVTKGAAVDGLNTLTIEPLVNANRVPNRFIYWGTALDLRHTNRAPFDFVYTSLFLKPLAEMNFKNEVKGYPFEFMTTTNSYMYFEPQVKERLTR